MGFNIVPLDHERPPPSDNPEQAAEPLHFTIITPSLNRGDWIEAAISCVAAQNYPNLEHIIVDGGSRDDTLARLARYPSLVVLHGPDRNSHHAMNKGLAIAKGEIIGFLNTDDLYPVGALHAIGQCFARRPDVMAIRGRCLLAEPGRPPEAELLHYDDDLWGQLLFGAPGFNSWFFRRETLEALGGLDEHLVIAADRDLLIRMVLRGWRPATIVDPVYVYHRHEGSATLDHEGRQAISLLSEHVTLALRHINSGGDGNRERMEAFLAFEGWQLIVRLIRAGRIGEVMRLLGRLAVWLPHWPAAMRRAQVWRRRLIRNQADRVSRTSISR